MKQFAFLAGLLLVSGCSGTSGGSTGKDAVAPDLFDNFTADTAVGSDSDALTNADASIDSDAMQTAVDTFQIQDLPAPPEHLPFKLTRPDEGQPLSKRETQDFTRKITGLWRKINYFRWVNWTSHGMDASTGKPDYQVWWQDDHAVKTGDLVTFRHSKREGGAHNIGIPTAKVLAQAMAAYVYNSDKYAGTVAEQYCKGLTATMKGMMWDENDPNKYIMARNIVNQNYSVTLEGGRKKAVDYTEWYDTYESWNAQRLHYPHNPYWGDIYVTNMRSKDDVCHIFLTAAFIPYFLRDTATDDKAHQACAETLDYLKGFAKDIVDHDYHIRTKDAEGKPYIPDQDLASFVDYVKVDPKSECSARLGSALLAYGDERDVTDCGSGYGALYEKFAVASHYFNYSIINHYHLAAVALALTMGRYRTAYEQLLGLVDRANHYMHPDKTEPGPKESDFWGADRAVFLLQAATVGLPLTSAEAREIQKYYAGFVDEYLDWPRWDLWDPKVPDGVYDHRSGYHPKHLPDTVSVRDLEFLVQYCYSPFRNPDGVSPVDCDIVKDMSKWGNPTK